MVTFFKRERGDLFRNRFFNFLFRNRRFVFWLRVAVAALFFFAIWMGYAHPGKENLFTTALFWGIFWPFFIVTTLPTFGRIFCGICPHGFLGTYITRMGLKRKMPRWMQNRFIGVMLLFLGWWGVYYMFPGAYRTPLGTAILFTVMTLIAFVVYFLYRDMSYCKYICPIGTALRAFGKLSFTSYGSYRSACESCKTFDCAHACPYGLSPFNFEKKNSMDDCTLCMECSHSCEAIRFRFVKPGHAIYQKFKILKAEVWVYILILAAIPISMAFHHGLGRSRIADEMIWAKTAHFFGRFIDFGSLDAVGMFAFLYATLFTVAAATVGMWIAAKILRKDFSTVFYTLGYAFAPLFILASMAHAWEFFFTSNSARIVEGLAWGFGMHVDVDPLARRGEAWLSVFHLFRWIAVIWAFYILYRRFAHIDAPTKRKILAYPFAALLILFFIGVNLYRSHVIETYGRQARHGMHGMHGGMMMAPGFQKVSPEKAMILQKGPHASDCVVCGMKLPMFFKTNHVAELNGTTRQYCSIHCLAKDLKIARNPLESIRVVDTDTLRFIDAKRAFYVVGSSKPGTMSRVSKYAFGTREAAEAFAAKYGGRVTDFEGALRTAMRDFRGAPIAATPRSTIFFVERNPSMGRGMGHRMGGMHRRAPGAVPKRSFWLATGSIAHPRCLRTQGGELTVTDPTGKRIEAKLSRKGGCSKVTIEVGKNGYYTLYYRERLGHTELIAEHEYKYFDHGSDEKFTPEKIAPHPLGNLPLELVRLRRGEDSFYRRFQAGDLLEFRALRYGKPQPGVRLKLTTQFGWSKSVRTDSNGTAKIRLIRDYLPEPEKFNRRFRERFLVAVSYRDRNGSVRLGYAGRYSPDREMYLSYAWGMLLTVLLLIVFGGAVWLYRWRVHKPFKEVVIDDRA
ncbi:nitrous oxide reductase accessory protein NosL [Nitratifractor sp.]